MIDVSEIRRCADALEHASPANHRLVLDLHGERYELRCDDASLADALRLYFATFVSDESDAPTSVKISTYERPAPAFDPAEVITPPLGRGSKRLKEQYVERPDGRFVLKTRTGMVFGFGGAHNIAVGPCNANPNQVVNFVNNRLMSRALERGAVLAHAAAVAKDGAAIAFAGFSGMGKSTTALHLMNVPDTVFVSNDRLLLHARPDGEVMAAGVPKHPRINPGTALHNPALAGIVSEEKAATLRALPRDELWHLEDKYDAIIERCFGPDRFRLLAPLRAFVVLNWDTPSAPLTVTECAISDRVDLLDAIMKGPGLFHRPGHPLPTPDPRAYLEVLRDVPIIELSGGPDFDGAVRECLRLFEAASPRVDPT